MSTNLFDNLPLLFMGMLLALIGALIGHTFIGEIGESVFGKPFVLMPTKNRRENATEYFRRLFLNIYVCNTSVMLSVLVTRPFIGGSGLMDSGVLQSSIIVMIIVLSIRAIAVLFENAGQFLVRPLILWIDVSFAIICFVSLLYPDIIRKVISDRSGGSSAVYWDILFAIPLMAGIMLMVIDGVKGLSSAGSWCGTGIVAWLRRAGESRETDNS